jgi:hypothetical protein
MSMTEAGVVFEHSLWPGLMICEKRNLPAFASRQEMAAFRERYCPSARVVREGVCKFCQRWHFASKPRGPSGASSGTERSS